VLMARVNGLGRLIPTPALNKIMLHRVVGGLEDPHLNCTLYLYNEPSTVTVTVTVLLPSHTAIGTDHIWAMYIKTH
jgi:hypothetical protein